MLLAIDVGNTNIVLGIFDPAGRLVADWRWASEHARMADEYAALITMNLADVDLRRADVQGVVLASVVPALTTTFRELAQRYFDCEPLVVHGGLRTDLVLRVDTPE